MPRAHNSEPKQTNNKTTYSILFGKKQKTAVSPLGPVIFNPARFCLVIETLWKSQTQICWHFRELNTVWAAYCIYWKISGRSSDLLPS